MIKTGNQSIFYVVYARKYLCLCLFLSPLSTFLRMAAFNISLVIPLYDEAELFDNLRKRLIALIETSNERIEVILVDDGSTDGTTILVTLLAQNDQRFTGVLLSRNFGHQKAIAAGMSFARGTEAVMILDGDLQDPPELLNEFLNELRKGHDVVYGIRRNRKENALKRWSYHVFYRLLRYISKTDIHLDSGDFALMSRRIVDIVNSMEEENRFLRGIRSWVGFSQKGLEYDRNVRFAGKTKYSFARLYVLAKDGIFNFSDVPIKLVSIAGSITIFISMTYFLITLIRKYFFHDVPIGFTALLFVITLFGGVQLLSIGIIGEYILRIFLQSKNRPLYIVKTVIRDASKIANGNK